MKKSFHTVKKAGILTAAAVLGTAALAGCGSKADTTESAASSEEATEAVGEAEASDAQLVIAGGDSARIDRGGSGGSRGHGSVEDPDSGTGRRAGGRYGRDGAVCQCSQYR